jgi:hypothetical protein
VAGRAVRHNVTMTRTAETTSLQRTYRYLRIGLAATVVVIFVSVAVAIPVVGLLPSISHYFYTPARNAFVGALLAGTLALLALSGRRAEPVLLDAAALVAPLIAVVPAEIAPGSVPGLDDGCVDACVPAAFWPSINNGIATYLIVGTLAVIVAIAMPGFRRLVPGGLIAIAVLAIVTISWGFFFDAFLTYAHVVASVAFFGLIAAVAVVNAIGRREDEFPPTRPFRISYVVIAVLMVLDMGVLIPSAIFGGGDAWGVLVCESLALALFLVFWILQTAQKWDESDPTLIAV